MVDELIKLWRQFCSYMVEVHPNHTDADFSFDNFMAWLQEQEPPIDHTY